MKKKPEQPVKEEKAPQVEWHVFDASKEVLGRLSTQIASLLLGKHRTDSSKHTVSSVRVVVTNTDNLKVTGKKMKQKMYRHYSGHPGGLKERSLTEQIRRDSRLVIREAVSGMLPKNKLRAKRLNQLKIYAGSEHPHQAQIAKDTQEKTS